MCQRIWRSLLSLCIGALVAAATASANPPAAGCGCDSGANADGCRGKLIHAFKIGDGCAMPAGCSSFAAERTFAFGSCKQFFNPGNHCSSCKGALAGPRPQVPPCTYNTYLNR